MNGELTTCDMCGKTYKFFIWAFGSDKNLCRKCVTNRPQAYLDSIDVIDISKEHDIIYDEIEERHHRDNPRQRKQKVTNKSQHLSRYAYNKLQKEQDKITIAKFRKHEGSAVDVTGLG